MSVQNPCPKDTTWTFPDVIRASNCTAHECRAVETLVQPGVSLPPTIARLTGIHDAELRDAPRPELAIRRFLAFAGDAPLAADPRQLKPR